MSTIAFELVHRVGPKLEHSRPCKIVAEFTKHKQREAVRSLGRNLAGTQIYVHKKFPTHYEN